MSYEHDVFLSYSHQFKEWVEECFLPEFRHLLCEALNRPDSTVFFDRDGIHAGDAWPERLKRALATSRCLVSVWSPLYFHSDRRMRELSIMLCRENQLGYRTLERPDGLILPVRVNDGKYFPTYAAGIQWFDCERFARSPGVFKKSEKYLEFQDQMTTWIEQVAAAVNNAPAWNAEWLTPDWLDGAMLFRTPPAAIAKIQPPTLV